VCVGVKLENDWNAVDSVLGGGRMDVVGFNGELSDAKLVDGTTLEVSISIDVLANEVDV